MSKRKLIEWLIKLKLIEWLINLHQSQNFTHQLMLKIFENSHNPSHAYGLIS